MSTVRECALDLADRLNKGEPVEEAILAAGFDPDGGGNGFYVLPESEFHTFAESDVIDCSWENGASITVEKRDGEWSVWARGKVSRAT